MLAKLFSLYAPRSDAKLAIAAYLEELQAVPPLILSHALKRLTAQPRQFVPDVGTIRQECALFVRERHRIASGLDPNTPPLGGTLNVERWIERASEPLPALPAELEPRATPEQRERGSKLLGDLAERFSRGGSNVVPLERRGDSE